jgi:hypothetical protein
MPGVKSHRASWKLVELSFRITFSLNRKLKSYGFPAISKRQNVICHLNENWRK